MYKKLKKNYFLLMGILLMACYAVFLAAIGVTISIEGISEQLKIWLGLALLFAVPAGAHTFGSMQWFIGEPFYACVGFLISLVSCTGIKLMPGINAALSIMPLSEIYWPVMLVLSVIMPFAIWLMAIALILSGRVDPFEL